MAEPMTPDEQRALTRTLKTLEAFESEIKDLRRDIWLDEMHELMRAGPPDGWRPKGMSEPDE